MLQKHFDIDKQPIRTSYIILIIQKQTKLFSDLYLVRFLDFDKTLHHVIIRLFYGKSSIFQRMPSEMRKKLVL